MIYSLILRNRETIADFSEMEGDFFDFSMKVLKTINKNDEFTVVGNENYDFNVLIYDNYIFLAITKVRMWPSLVLCLLFIILTSYSPV